MPKPDSEVEHFRLAHPSEFCILRKRFSITTVSSLGHALAISGDAPVRTDGKRRGGPGRRRLFGRLEAHAAPAVTVEKYSFYQSE
jgi:hypothetical protein